MKNIWIMIMLMLVMTPMALAAEPVLRASVNKYEPIPAQPGDFVTVYIEIENIGNEEATNAVLEVLPEYPFSIDPVAARDEIGIIGAQRDYVTDFKIRVDEDAIPGTNELKIRFTPNQNLDLWTETELDIRVEGVGSDIQISSVTTNPEQLVPGQSGTLRIRVKNDAGTTIRDIKLNLDLDDTTTTTYPFAPIGTATQQRIPRLDPGESSEFVYTIQPYPDATSQLYKIPITLTYSDVADNDYTKTDLIGLVVNSAPEIMISIDDYRMDGTMILKVTNKGLSDVKFLTLYLVENKDYTIDGTTNSYYVGELESDDFDTTDFTISFEPEEIALPVKVEYRDANNNPYEEEFALKLKHHHLVNGNGNGGSTGTIIIIVIVVVVAGFIVWRIVKKRKRKD